MKERRRLRAELRKQYRDTLTPIDWIAKIGFSMLVGGLAGIGASYLLEGKGYFPGRW
jgi:hypothetical protein